MQSERVVVGCDAVRRELSKYSGWNVSVMTAISKAESGCRSDARGDGHLTYKRQGRTYGYSVSAFQVRILPGREHCDSYDLSVNVRCAYNLWKSKQDSGKNGYTHWSVYNDQSYAKFM